MCVKKDDSNDIDLRSGERQTEHTSHFKTLPVSQVAIKATERVHTR